MRHGCEFGDDPPDWFISIEAARYVRMNPVEFEAMPLKWRSRVIETMNLRAKVEDARRSKDK